jgi:hypothetical protein
MEISVDSGGIRIINSITSSNVRVAIILSRMKETLLVSSKSRIPALILANWVSREILSKGVLGMCFLLMGKSTSVTGI